MKQISLTKGYYAIIDNNDFETISKHSWCVSTTKRKHKYALSKINGKICSMHTLLMGDKTGKCIDHINCNGLDNRKVNLRFATRSQNAMNGLPRRNNSSKFKGVCWHKGKKKWVAYIGSNKNRRHLGCFLYETNAAIAYNNTAKILYGEYARLNPVN